MKLDKKTAGRITSLFNDIVVADIMLRHPPEDAKPGGSDWLEKRIRYHTLHARAVITLAEEFGIELPTLDQDRAWMGKDRAHMADTVAHLRITEESLKATEKMLESL